MLVERECEFCGDTFYTSNPSARFCPVCAVVRRLLLAIRNAWFDLRHPGWAVA